MPPVEIILPALANGVLTGGVYALVALGLTLIYGVLHIINFAHGSLLMLAMYGAYFAFTWLGIDPYLALPGLAALMGAVGYLMHRLVVGPFSHGDDRNVLLVTLGCSVVLDNLALALFTGDSRTIETPYGFAVLEVGPMFLSLPRLVSFAVAIVLCTALAVLIRHTDLGRAIRAVARERTGARLVGIDVEKVFAASFAIGIATLGAAACLLLPSFYVSPVVGNAFVLVAFTIVVLGGMGSFAGAMLGGVIVGVTESLGGLFLGEALGQIGISLIFIAILLLRPTGLFGQKA
ncbi:MAG: branched-chain amino acid ABC transporter permease [Acetobacteraceae bacterium]|nr:branched-chain amino acid ABC transporter permease [Acetobacteraceae bacterium]